MCVMHRSGSKFTLVVQVLVLRFSFTLFPKLLIKSNSRNKKFQISMVLFQSWRAEEYIQEPHTLNTWQHEQKAKNSTRSEL